VVEDDATRRAHRYQRIPPMKERLRSKTPMPIGEHIAAIDQKDDPGMVH
jgi:hypothetical protein